MIKFTLEEFLIGSRTRTIVKIARIFHTWREYAANTYEHVSDLLYDGVASPCTARLFKQEKIVDNPNDFFKPITVTGQPNFFFSCFLSFDCVKKNKKVSKLLFSTFNNTKLRSIVWRITLQQVIPTSQQKSPLLSA